MWCVFAIDAINDHDFILQFLQCWLEMESRLTGDLPVEGDARDERFDKR